MSCERLLEELGFDRPYEKRIVIYYGPNTLAPTDDRMLDLYLPKGRRERRPVAIFVHGGAWNTGRGTLQPQLRDRLLREGFLLLRPNYTLSPNPPRLQDSLRPMHPVHVSDLAMVLGWVHTHITSYGGDPSAVHLIGVSAGAHLSNLLATNHRFLAQQGLDRGALASVVSIDAGPYLYVQSQEMKSWHYYPQWQNAFGQDTLAWRDASPGYHLPGTGPLPRFLLLYSGDERFRKMPNLRYAQRLREAGASVELLPAMSYDHQSIYSSIGTSADTIGMLDRIVYFLKD